MERILAPGGPVQDPQDPTCGMVPDVITVMLPSVNQTSGWDAKKDPRAGFTPSGSEMHDKYCGN
jgi:hypothetical protein